MLLLQNAWMESVPLPLFEVAKGRGKGRKQLTRGKLVELRFVQWAVNGLPITSTVNNKIICDGTIEASESIFARMLLDHNILVVSPNGKHSRPDKGT